MEVKLPFPPDHGTLQDVKWGFHRPPPWCHPSTILDLGANIGLTLLDFAELFPFSFIVGVELDYANAAVAMDNVSHLSNVRVVNAAVATQNGVVEYNGSIGTNAFYVGSGDRRAESMTIDTIIDTYFPGDTVDFMKVDIEGMERDIFKAQGATWPYRVRCLSLECHYGYEPAEAMMDLESLGYSTQIHNFGPPAPGMQEHWVVWARS